MIFRKGLEWYKILHKLPVLFEPRNRVKKIIVVNYSRVTALWRKLFFIGQIMANHGESWLNIVFDGEEMAKIFTRVRFPLELLLNVIWG